jgi:DNA-binding GntR family transcriptional regulator
MARPALGTATPRDRIVRAVEEDIAEGRLRPGERLDERLLAERFEVSRTPVREALNRLASNGFIETRSHHGAVVASMTMTSLLEMFEVMQTLEKTCAELAARRMTTAERKALLAEARKGVAIAAKADRRKYAMHNVAFHKLIYAGARNAILTEMAQHARQRVAVYRRLAFNIEGLMQASAKEHAELARAIGDNEPERAAALMTVHMKRSGPMYDDFLVLLGKGSVEGKGKKR